MINEADKLPLAQMDDLLRHGEGHMYDRDLLVVRARCLVGKQRVITDPALHQGLLWVIKYLLVLRDHILAKIGGDEAKPNHVASILLVDDAANDTAVVADA